jgi:hypothetical protein
MHQSTPGLHARIIIPEGMRQSARERCEAVT